MSKIEPIEPQSHGTDWQLSEGKEEEGTDWEKVKRRSKNVYEGSMDMDSSEGTGYGSGGWAGEVKGEKRDNGNSIKT